MKYLSKRGRNGTDFFLGNITSVGDQVCFSLFTPLVPGKGNLNFTEYKDILENWGPLCRMSFLVPARRSTSTKQRAVTLSSIQHTWEELEHRLWTRPCHPTPGPDLTNTIVTEWKWIPLVTFQKSGVKPSQKSGCCCSNVEVTSISMPLLQECSTNMMFRCPHTFEQVVFLVGAHLIVIQFHRRMGPDSFCRNRWSAIKIHTPVVSVRPMNGWNWGLLSHVQSTVFQSTMECLL